PGRFASLTWDSLDTFAASNLPATVLVAHGAARGPVYCLTAAVHGDELNGIETVRRILYTLDTGRLRGTVIGVPIVNVQGFNRGSRYLPDRRDLNRFFPGNRRGSAAARIAHSLFTNVIRHCDALVDLHTGSFQRTNLPQIRADLADPGALALTEGFGSAVVLHNSGQSGTLRAAATRAGIAAVTLEAGGPLQVQPDAVAASEAAIRTLLHAKGLYRVGDNAASAGPTYYRSSWVRTDHGGILASQVSLGATVAPGDLLGTVVDPLTNEQTTIRSPRAARVIGMAFDQFVLPGYATFHLGVEATVKECIEEDDEAVDPDSEAAETDAAGTGAAR
ncbi:MAG: succinylglutamate desuccinylase/aspartoacylase family protein, partial [Gammaproteobacteria bacterium]